MMAEVTKSLITEIGEVCLLFGCACNVDTQLVGIQITDNKHCSIAFEMIVRTMESNGLSVGGAINYLLKDVHMVPEEDVVVLESLPVVTDVSKSELEVGDRYLSSADCLAALSEVKDGDCVWIYEVCSVGVRSVPVLVRVPEEDAKDAKA